MANAQSRLKLGQSASLSEVIDLSCQTNLLPLQRLLPSRIVQTGVYDTPKTKEELQSKLKDCSCELYKEHTDLYYTLKLYDVGVGTPESVSDSLLRQLVHNHLLDAKTPVHFRCLYGGLFLFVLTDDIEVKYLKSDHTYIHVATDNCEVFSSRIGAPTYPNQVWMRTQYDGKTSSLAKTLAIPYLTSYCLTTTENFYRDDIPC